MRKFTGMKRAVSFAMAVALVASIAFTDMAQVYAAEKEYTPGTEAANYADLAQKADAAAAEAQRLEKETVEAAKAAEQAAKDAEAAQQAAEAAQKEAEAAAKAAEAAAQAAEAEKAAGTQAQGSVDSAIGNANTAINKADSSIDDFNNALEDKAITGVKATTEAYAEAAKNAQTVEEAKAAAENAEAAYQAALEKLNAILKLEETADENTNTANAEIEAAKAAEKNAKEALEKAEAAYDEDIKESGTAEAATDKAENAADTAIGEHTKADTAARNASTSLTTVTNNRNTIEKDAATTADILAQLKQSMTANELQQLEDAAKNNKTSVDTAQDAVIADANTSISNATKDIEAKTTENSNILNSDEYKNAVSLVDLASKDSNVVDHYDYPWWDVFKKHGTPVYKSNLKVWTNSSDKTQYNAYLAAVNTKAAKESTMSANNAAIVKDNELIASKTGVISTANELKKQAADAYTEAQRKNNTVKDYVITDEAMIAKDYSYTEELQAYITKLDSELQESNGKFAEIARDTTTYMNVEITSKGFWDVLKGCFTGDTWSDINKTWNLESKYHNDAWYHRSADGTNHLFLLFDNDDNTALLIQLADNSLKLRSIDAVELDTTKASASAVVAAITAKNTAEDAKQASDAAKATEDITSAVLAAANAAAASKTKEAEALKEYGNAAKAVEDAQATVDALKVNKTKNSKALEEAKKALEEAKVAKEAAKKAYEEAKEAAEKANEELTEIINEVIEAEGEQPYAGGNDVVDDTPVVRVAAAPVAENVVAIPQVNVPLAGARRVARAAINNEVVEEAEDEEIEEIQAEEVPLAVEEEETEEIAIAEEEVPLAIESSWALLNLILTGFAIGMVILFVIKSSKREEALVEDDEKKALSTNGLITSLAAIASVITFILTEDMTKNMQIVDRWTLLMAAYVIAQFVIYAVEVREQKKIKDAQ